MADITICSNLTCPKRMTCYRYVAEPDKIQSYSKFSDCGEEKFPHYIPATLVEIDAYKKRNGYE